MTQEQIVSILRSEFLYWNDSETDLPQPAEDAIRIGAVCAVSNVIAAIYGKPAPWHENKAGDHHPVWPCFFEVWGKPWLGVRRIRVLLPNGHKTFWHFTLGKFSFGISLPASVVKRLETRRTGAGK